MIAECGTRSRYSQGCRCASCRAAQAAYHQERKTRERRTCCVWCSAVLPPRRSKYCSDVCHDYGKRADLYSLDPVEYQRLVRACHGQCRLCDAVTPLHVDHNHDTGEVRGMLCGPCNRALGQMGDNIHGLERALAYLGGAGHWRDGVQ